MAVSSHKSVLAGVDLLAGRAMGRSAKGIRRDMEPLVAVIKDAKSFDGLRKVLSAALMKRMGTGAMATALGDAGVQAKLIGITAATPRDRQRGKIDE